MSFNPRQKINGMQGNRYHRFIVLIVGGFILSTISPMPAMAAVPLSYSDAVGRAIQNNLLMRVSRERIEEAAGRKIQADSDLFPHLSIAATQSRVFNENLDSLGFPGGGNLGPFNTLDARVQLVQRVFDLSAFSRHQAGLSDFKIVNFEEDLAQQQVILTAAMAYLKVLHTQERLQAVQEDKKLAQQLFMLAQHQWDAGIATQLDVTRAKTRLAQEESLAEESRLNLDKAYLELQRVVGLPLSGTVELTNSLKFFEEPTLPLEKAIAKAENGRVEIKIAGETVQHAQYKVDEAKNQRWPQVSFIGDVGRAGTEVSQKTSEVSEVGVQVKLPIFEGGRIAGQVKEQASKKAQQEMTRDDVQIQVEEDMSVALKTLSSSKLQVLAAQEALILATKELDLAKNQFVSGVGDNVQVVTAQTTLANSRETYIAALTNYHLARINYYSALGKIEDFHL